MRKLGLLVLFLIFGLAGTVQAQDTYADARPEQIDLSKLVQIYPNPATEFVHVRVDQFLADNIKLSVHNIIGNEIAVETEKISPHEIRIRVKDLVAGYYLLALRDDTDRFRGTYKFLKR